MKQLFLAVAILALLPTLVIAAPTFNWSTAYDGGGNYNDEVRIIITAPDGNPVVAGTSHDGIDGGDLLIRKLSKVDGSLIWSRRFPAYDDSDMFVCGIAWDPDGDLIVGGHVLGCEG
ncbi:MAG: hypothetical protein GY752_05960 [bacterium]|nr:hypothetical protein [bacterium]MCP4800920.1 hypothetical protein [bacterium]